MELENKKAITYCSYNGSDIIIYINNISVGEIQGIKYNTIKKELLIESINFIENNDSEDLASVSKGYSLMTSLKDAKIQILSANEKGYKKYREIRGVNYIGEIGSNYIDDIVTSSKYVYSFEEITPPLNIKKDISKDTIIKYSDEILESI